MLGEGRGRCYSWHLLGGWVWDVCGEGCWREDGDEDGW